MNQPICGKCGKVMTPQNAKIRPQLFLHDDCLPDELRPQVMATYSTEWKGPKTQEEARMFHQGFISGLTVYAREKGDSTLKGQNELLRRLMDEQGWKTIELYEKLADDAAGKCEHGVRIGEWCPQCNRDYKTAAKENQDAV